MSYAVHADDYGLAVAYVNAFAAAHAYVNAFAFALAIATADATALVLRPHFRSFQPSSCSDRDKKP